MGKDISAKRLSQLFYELEQQGAHNINLVNPTHFADQIFHALDLYRPQIPIVWNTHGYEREETLKRAQPYVDIYLTDLKYDDPFLSERYSGAKDYPRLAKQAALIMRAQKADTFDGEGLMQTGLIVRHLILPGGVYDSVNLLKWLAQNLPDTLISLMSQYTPYGNLQRFPELQRN